VRFGKNRLAVVIVGIGVCWLGVERWEASYIGSREPGLEIVVRVDIRLRGEVLMGTHFFCAGISSVGVAG
jgi:hypothetical protein